MRFYWAFLCLFLTISRAAAAQDTTGVGTLTGSVRDQSGPVAEAAVCLTATRQCAVTGSTGTFAIAGVRAGTHRLEVVAPGRPVVAAPAITGRAGLESRVEVVLPMTAFEQVVTVEAPPVVAAEEIKSSAYLIQAREIANSAGALQDVSRYVQSLPGVVIGSNDFRNDLIVRGGSPLENLYIVGARGVGLLGITHSRARVTFSG